MKVPEMWIIRNKNTGEIWRASSGKSSWKAKGHAKGAWANSYGGYCYYRMSEACDKKCSELGVEKVFDRKYDGEDVYRVPYFDEQDTYVLEELHYDLTVKLTKAEAILKDILTNWECDEIIDKQIKRYFNIE